MNRDEYEEAAHWFELHLDVRPSKNTDSEEALYGLVVAYTDRLKWYVDGLNAAEQYLSEFPDGRKLWGVLKQKATCHEKLGQIDEAIAALQSAYDIADSEELRSYSEKRIADMQKGVQQ